MASEANGLWNNLPSIIVVEILSFLSVKDRLHTSSVCKAWRNCLFHPTLWRKVFLPVNSCDNEPRKEWAKFLVKNCGRFVREVVIEVNSLNPKDVHICKDILKILTFNRNLRALSLRPCSSRLEWLDFFDMQSIEQYAESLLQITERACRLEHLSLGCIEELMDYASHFLESLGKNQAAYLRSLHLASVKEVPGSISLANIKISMFEPFYNLESLSLDYDHMCDQLLYLLSQPQRKPLSQINIHVHYVEMGQEVVSTSAWKQLSTHSPGLQVTMNLLHFHVYPNGLRDILSDSMPLKHFRSYFCSGFDIEILNRIAFLNHATLETLTLVDGLNEDATPSFTFLSFEIDPLVMLAWRCKKLSSLTVIGYEVSGDNLIAISRLRGAQLKEFKIPLCCISMLQLDDSITFSCEEAYQQLLDEVSFSLQRSWHPMSLSELPPAVCNMFVDADGAYLHNLLEDQKW